MGGYGRFQRGDRVEGRAVHGENTDGVRASLTSGPGTGYKVSAKKGVSVQGFDQPGHRKWVSSQKAVRVENAWDGLSPFPPAETGSTC